MSVQPLILTTEAHIWRTLRKLCHLSLRRHSIKLLSGLVRQLITTDQVLRCLELPAGTLVYRGVPCQKLPSRVQHPSYPPPERVARNQQANRAGVPMFYASATWHPPFFEAGMQPTTRFSLAAESAGSRGAWLA